MTLNPQDATDLAKQIAPMLAGKHPAIHGAALADLLAMWVAGHPPQVRDEMLLMHIEKVNDLVLVNAKVIDRAMRKSRKSRATMTIAET